MIDSAELTKTARLAGQVVWAPLAVLILHALASKMFGHEPYIDPIMHFLGGAAAAYFFRHMCSGSPAIVGTLTPLGADLLALGLTCGTALFWEFSEYISDQYLSTNVQLSLANTMRDLVLGVLGAITYLVYATIIRSLKRIKV